MAAQNVMENPSVKTEKEEVKKDSQNRKKRRGPRLTGVSRQRRLANARERNRVQIINENIDRLRELIPLFPDEKKPTKTETIRLAAVYISCLTELLQSSDEQEDDVFADLRLPIPALNFDIEPFLEEGNNSNFIHGSFVKIFVYCSFFIIVLVLEM